MPLIVMLVVLLGAALHATWNGLVKGGSDRYLDTAALLMGASVICLGLLLVLPPVSRRCIVPMIASAIVHQAYFNLIALSYRKGEMSVVYPISRGAAPALTAIGSLLTLDRTSFAGEWLGIAFISSGVILLAFDSRRQTDVHRRTIAIALLNSVVIAFYTLIDGTGARLSGAPLAYTCWNFVLTSLLFVPTALIIRRTAAVTHFREKWRRGLLGGACSLGAYAATLWAMTQSSIASVAALRETSIVFGVLIAAHRLHEPVTRKRWAAVALVVVGAVAIKLW